MTGLATFLSFTYFNAENNNLKYLLDVAHLGSISFDSFRHLNDQGVAELKYCTAAIMKDLMGVGLSGLRTLQLVSIFA